MATAALNSLTFSRGHFLFHGAQEPDLLVVVLDKVFEHGDHAEVILFGCIGANFHSQVTHQIQVVFHNLRDFTTREEARGFFLDGGHV